MLAAKRPVVLDASFREQSKRQAALELARRHGAQFRFIECRVSEAISRARLAQRARGPSVSDGRAEIFDAFVASYEPVQELPAEAHVPLDTEGPLAETLARLRERLQMDG